MSGVTAQISTRFSDDQMKSEYPSRIQSGLGKRDTDSPSLAVIPSRELPPEELEADKCGRKHEEVGDLNDRKLPLRRGLRDVDDDADEPGVQAGSTSH